MSQQQELGQEPVTYGHDAIECALGIWRDGWKQSTRINLPESWRAEYALAVRRVLTELQGLWTMQKLMTWYYHELPEMDRLLDELVHAPSGHLLKYSVIEDAAYWRRAWQLLPAAPEGHDDGPAL
jgi:hypothetical protein